MAGLDEGTVDYKPTYNGEEEEPEVFPACSPTARQWLERDRGRNGDQHPPHNVGELIEAASHPDRQSAQPRTGR